MVFIATKNLLQIIKQVALEAVEEKEPLLALFGTVKSISPLSIYLEQKSTITQSYIVILDKVKNLEVGDGVVMLQMQGGQKYIVLDKVVENG